MKASHKFTKIMKILHHFLGVGSFGAVSLQMVCAMNSTTVRVGLPAIPLRMYSKSAPFVIMTFVASYICDDSQNVSIYISKMLQ